MVINLVVSGSKNNNDNKPSKNDNKDKDNKPVNNDNEESHQISRTELFSNNIAKILKL